MYKYVQSEAIQEDKTRWANTKIFYERAIPLWKKIFHLPADGVWYTTILLLAYVSVIMNLYMAVLAKCTNLWSGWAGTCYALDCLYLIDVILSIGSMYIPHLDMPPINLSARSPVIFALDIMSLLPIEVTVKPTTLQQTKMFCIMRINRCIRFVRLLYFNVKYYQLIDCKVYVQIANMYSCFLFLILLAYTIYCNVLCFNEICPKNHDCFTYKIVQIITTKLCSGFAEIEGTLLSEMVITCTTLINFYFLYLITMAHLTISLINIFRHQIIFINRYNSVHQRLKFHRIPSSIIKEFTIYYNLVWEYRQGYIEHKLPPDILPAIMYNEVMVDIMWSTFKHSKLFRNMSLPFLRHLSNCVELKYMAPGEYVFVRNEIKDKMVYVVFGTIELLSQEDGESPVLTFTGGTCLGESCLVISYKSLNSVRCKTYCEFHVLERKSLMDVLNIFPEEFRKLHNIITRRYNEIKAHYDVASIAKSKLHDVSRPIDTHTLLWLKNTLHNLMGKDDESTYRHSFQNIYLMDEINAKKQDKLIFMADYLDLYVVGERTEVDTDTLFIKTAFPCILQPNSLIVYIWEAAIILITICLSFLIPFMSFISEDTLKWYPPFIQIATLIFWFDLYVQLSTAVRERQSVTTTLKAAAISKMQTVGFWVDILSSIPCEMFTSTVLNNCSSQNAARMHMNRTLKLWRVEKIFRLWEKQFNINVVLIRYVKFSWINAYTIFIFYCKLYKTSGKPSTIVYTAVQLISGVGLTEDKHDHWNDMFYNFTDIISTFINLMMYAHIMSAYVMTFLDRSEVQEHCYDLVNLIKNKKLNDYYNIRINNFVNAKMIESYGVNFKQDKVLISGFPTRTYDACMKLVAFDRIKSIKFFENLSDEVLLDFCTVMTMGVFPPNEMIAHVGDVVKTINILCVGVCEMLNVNNVSQKIINSAAAINLEEILLDVPVVHSYLTRTHCICLVTTQARFRKLLGRYPEQWKYLRSAVASSSDVRQKLIELTRTDEILKSPLVNIPRPSFYKFGYNHLADSYEEFDYFIPFDRLYPFACIKYLLMRTTVLPHGTFFFVWEISRCVFAVASAILYFVIPFVNSEYSKVLLILDAAAMVDIYVRLHVCFYDAKGLLIKHPLRTSRHYLMHGFFIDCLAVWPFGLFVSTKDAVLYFILHINRLLQLHRCFSFLKYLFNVSITPTNKLYGFSVIPFIVVLSNAFGSLLINSECSFDSSDAPNDTANFYAGITCRAGSVLATSNFSKPIGPYRAHLYGVYIATSAFTTVGLHGFSTQSNSDRNLIIIMSIAGLYLTAVYAGKTLLLYYSHNIALLDHQNAISTLKKFMNVVGVNQSLKKTIIDSYELKWERAKGQDIKHLIKPFNVPFQYDLLYDVYGKLLFENSVFQNRSKPFYRNLLPHANHEIIMKGGYIETINYIGEHIHILYKGVVEVLAPDGTHMVNLYPGSMFGNLKDRPQTRELISVVANCHVEIISTKSTMFHKVLGYYPDIKDEYYALKSKHECYIPSTTYEIATPTDATIVYKQTFWGKTFNPYSKSTQIINGLNIIFSCYLAVILQLYQVGSCEFSIPFIIWQYSCDIFYIVHFFVENRTAFEDGDGNLVTDIALVWKENTKHTLRYWIALCSLIPFDFLIFFAKMEHTAKYTAFIFLRLNRFLRIKYVFEYFLSSKQKLNVNAYVIRFGYILIWGSVALCSFACFFSVLSRNLDLNMERKIPPYSVIQTYAWHQKFELFVNCFYLATDCLTFTAENDYYPQHAVLIIYFIAVMVISHNLFIVTFCQIFTIVHECNLKKYYFRNRYNELKSFMQRKDVSVSLRNRIETYVQLFWLKQGGVQFPKLLAGAPPYLQDAILMDSFSHLIVDHPIFAKCHKDCLRQIVQRMRPVSFFTGDFIQIRNTIDSTMYFVFQGEVAVLQNENLCKGDIVRMLKNGDSFGLLQGLYHGTPHIYTYCSMKYTIMVTLNLKSWETLLNFFPASKEKIYDAAAIYTGL